MRVALFGISCVGKSTLGAKLAEIYDYRFVDFDAEVRARMNMSITRIKKSCFNEHRYRQTVKHILPEILSENPDNMVLAMPPGGLLREYKTVFDRNPDVLTVVLKDRSVNILNRLVFTDDDDEIIDEQVVTDENRHLYYREIRKDVEYFRASLSKARLSFNIDGRGIDDAAIALADFIDAYQKGGEA